MLGSYYSTLFNASAAVVVVVLYFFYALTIWACSRIHTLRNRSNFTPYIHCQYVNRVLLRMYVNTELVYTWIVRLKSPHLSFFTHIFKIKPLELFYAIIFCLVIDMKNTKIKFYMYKIYIESIPWHFILDVYKCYGQGFSVRWFLLTHIIKHWFLRGNFK